MPTKTQGKESVGNADAFASGFSLQELDIFGGSGTRGEEVDVDAEALAEQAGVSDGGKKKTKKPAKKRSFGFG